MIKINLSVLLALTWAAMNVQAQTLSKPYKVSGYLEGLKTSNGFLYLRGNINGKNITDSIRTTDGYFTFSGEAEPVLIRLFAKRVGRPNFFNPIDFFLDGSDIKITAVYDTTKTTFFSDVKITGSASQDEYENFMKQQMALGKNLGLDFKKLANDYKSAALRKDTVAMNAVNKAYGDYLDKRGKFIASFIKTHPKSFVSLDQITTMLISPDEKTLKEAGELFLSLDPALQFSDRGKKVTDRMQVASRGMILNTIADDFAQPTAAGKLIKLSDYRGKYVLLDFWASWCGPCRAENPNVLKNYKQYKDQGFDILAVSLDSDANKWKKAIKEDQLPWTQVSDLKQSNNAAAQQFGVLVIPDNFLIDPKGVVIARGLRGEALDKKLAALFSK